MSEKTTYVVHQFYNNWMDGDEYDNYPEARRIAEGARMCVTEITWTFFDSNPLDDYRTAETIAEELAEARDENANYDEDCEDDEEEDLVLGGGPYSTDHD